MATLHGALPCAPYAGFLNIGAKEALVLAAMRCWYPQGDQRQWGPPAYFEAELARLELQRQAVEAWTGEEAKERAHGAYRKACAENDIANTQRGELCNHYAALLAELRALRLPDDAIELRQRLIEYLQECIESNQPLPQVQRLYGPGYKAAELEQINYAVQRVNSLLEQARSDEATRTAALKRIERLRAALGSDSAGQNI